MPQPSSPTSKTHVRISYRAASRLCQASHRPIRPCGEALSRKDKAPPPSLGIVRNLSELQGFILVDFLSVVRRPQRDKGEIGKGNCQPPKRRHMSWAVLPWLTCYQNVLTNINESLTGRSACSLPVISSLSSHGGTVSRYAIMMCGSLPWLFGMLFVNVPAAHYSCT